MSSRTEIDINLQQHDAATITRVFSQQLARALDVDQVTQVLITTLRRLFGIQRAGLLLAHEAESNHNRLALYLTHGSLSDVQWRYTYLSRTSPIYRYLTEEELPLLHNDLENHPRFNMTLETELGFFRNLRMQGYAPILVENALVGVMICGPKDDGHFFTASELNLLGTLAAQIGSTLWNMQLVRDLRRLNGELARVNGALENTNYKLEKLDTVKTDFVTIASHELRTPLAQLRGYIDIMGTLNDQGMLDAEETRLVVSNLQKAVLRMEELLVAMLDVSQLDVNAMDLRFSPATLESMIKLAIEPMADAIRHRKQTVSARGLRTLPLIQADSQRLVQAFRNVIINAIKFTPDSGQIEITGSLYPAEHPHETEMIVIAITDTGVGIAPENLELIFQKFYRGHDPSLHSTGKYKFMGAGPGLGLTIARGVIEGHGGRIWAESSGFDKEVCPGSTLYIVLPIEPPTSAGQVKSFDWQAVTHARRPAK
jgi:signal transduction histidine kinase